MVKNHSALPVGCIWRGVKKEKFTDIQVSHRSQRLVPLLVALGGILVGLLLLSASHPLVATLMAVIVSFALATVITQAAKYKISLYIDSAADAVTVCCLLVSPVYLSLTPLVVLIAWARVHSPLQAICGAALAVEVTVTTFWFFGLR